MTQQNTTQRLSKFYRSIQYKSASLDIKPNKININTDKLPLFQLKKPNLKTPQRSNKTHLFHSTQNINNVAKSLSHSLSKIHQSDLNTTLISEAQNPQNQNNYNFGTCTYIESFQQLMQTEQKHTCKRKKLGALSIKLDSLKNTSKIDRIALPNIIEYQNSQFTALDPIRLPINSVKEDIERTKKSMEQCPIQLRSIRCEMKEFQNRNIKELDEFDSQFKEGVKKLWGKLRENSVYHQGFIMRVRRQIKGLQGFIPEFTKQFEATQANQLEVQKTIFETAPFELRKNMEHTNNQIFDEKMKLSLQKDYF